MNQFSPLEDASPIADTPRLSRSRAAKKTKTPTALSKAPRKSAATNPQPAPARPVPNTKGKKHFVLDTNVLLHNPSSIGRFGDNHVCIPVDVLSELDRFKNEQSDRGANARAVHRALSAAFADGDSVTDGVPTEGGGTLRLALFDMPTGSRKPTWVTRFRRILPDSAPVDHRIIATALRLQGEVPDPVVLVTKDINMQLKAKAVGLVCEDYLNDKVEAADVSTYDLRKVAVEAHELQRFGSSGELALTIDRVDSLHLNEYIILNTDDNKALPARFGPDGILRRLTGPKSLSIPGGTGISPINIGQQCLLDALLDPSISLVTCYGHAGTGKTLLAVAAGLHSVFSGAHRGLTISRPVVAMGDTLGFLPGTLDDKMRPWLQPIYDALEFLMPPALVSQGAKKRGQKPKSAEMFAPPSPPSVHKPYETLIEKGIVEVEALCYIRGRSIPQRYFILDEAQQLTPLEAKTVVTRMSKNSKLILVGDPAQIDNPYVDSRSNGLVYTRDRLKAQPVSAHVSLSKGERSSLAELGATLM